MATLNFDASNAPQQQTYEAMPAGWYNAVISNSEMKPTKAGDGAYLALTVQVVDGPYKGRTVFHNLNLKNANLVAVDIAYKQLSSICHATGIIQCADSQQLHNIPFQVKLKVKPAQGDYEAGNELSGFDKVNANAIVSTKAGAPVAGFGAPAKPAVPAAPAAPVAPPAAPAWQAPAAQQPWQQPAPAAPAPAPVAAAAPVAPPAWQAPAAPAAAPVQEAPAQFAAPVAPPAPFAPPVAAPVAAAPAGDAPPPWAAR